MVADNPAFEIPPSKSQEEGDTSSQNLITKRFPLKEGKNLCVSYESETAPSLVVGFHPEHNSYAVLIRSSGETYTPIAMIDLSGMVTSDTNDRDHMPQTELSPKGAKVIFRDGNFVQLFIQIEEA